MNCSIDIGNTFLKVGLFEGTTLVFVETFNNLEELTIALKKHEISKMIISNVAKKDISFLDSFNPLLFSYKTKTPIINKYETPTTLGADRIAAVIGANKLFPNKDVLIIDAGTCITYDFIKSNAEYLGGSISPGIKMKYKALHNFTANLPLLDSIDNTDLTGRSTDTAMNSGVVNGTIAEVSGIIERYKNISDNFALLFCGGDGDFLLSNIDYQSKYEKNLVLIGLNEVLIFNA